MTKSELEQYARENHKRLEAQDVKLGDVVKVLVGQFAGECGVIVGINAYDNDFSAPYYEVNMYCEVPDKYKCRKTLLTPNNVIGGVSVYDFEVIGNRAPKKQPNNTITIPVKADLDDTYWDAYKAELVKELVFKMIGGNEIKCLQNANYITDFATRIVDNLKKQTE